MTQNTRDGILEELKSAAAGLIYISETDAPFEVSSLGPLSSITARDVAQSFQLDGSAPSTETTLETFFQRLTTDQDWHNEEQKQRVKKFRVFREKVEKLLSNPKVFRIGEIQINIFIVGESSEGDCIVIQTRAVET